MTPLMVRALSDASACINHRGLEHGLGGWTSTLPMGVREMHAAATVNALVRRGYLAVWGGPRVGEVAHITPAGEHALSAWSERVAERASA